MTTSVRAEIILALKDEMSKPLAQAGKTGAGAMGDFKKGAQGMVQELTGLNLASIGVAGAMVGLASGIKFAVSEAMEAEKIMALTESTIKATGGAAGLTAGQIGQMAMRLSLLNAIDDETIQSAENLMLTFKKVKGDAFEPAMQAAIDLSVIMGTDLKSSTMMLGKALEDPVRGITALRRAGVSFTADQQKLIKSLVETGQAAEAQAMILAELNSQVGGAGAAAANTLSGQMEEVKIQFGNVAQMAGPLLIPAIGGVVDGFWGGTRGAGKLSLTLQDMLGICGVGQAALRGAALEAGDLTAVYTEQEAEVKGLTNSTAVYYAAVAAGTDIQEKFNIVASSTGGYYADVAAHATAAGDAQDRLNRRLSAALDAGLDGALQAAAEDYRNVLAETQPEIDKLNQDIARMNAAHGQSFTVVSEAKHSVEEYELAQLRAATAAQKLAEFNGDSREEYLELKIAADEAAGRVSAMGEQMGISQVFTADYTKKLMEANGSLGELEAKQLAAEAALVAATKQFLFQQLAIEGDHKANLELARSLGILDEASYNAALVAADLKQQYEDGALSAETYGVKAAGAAEAIARLQSKNITITYTTIYHEIHRQTIQDAVQAAGGQGGGVSEGTYDPKGGFAHGANFVVPAGFPNDSFRMNVQSGEHVQVTPANQVSQGGDADMANMLTSLQTSLDNLPRRIRDAMQKA